MGLTTELLLLVCSGAGFVISLYFTLISYEVVSPDLALLPRFCRLESQTCRQIFATPEARLLGIPNFILGLAYYVSLMLYVLFFADRVEAGMAGFGLLLASAVTVAVGTILTYALAFRLKIHCVLCYVSHGINLMIFLVVVYRIWSVL